MLKKWVKVLPVFIVEYLAYKGCERFMINIGTTNDPDSYRVVVNAFKGIYIEVDK